MVSRGSAAFPVSPASLARGYTEVGIKRLGGYASNPKTQPMVAIRAIELLLDRGWGRAPQAHKITGAEGGPIELIIRDLMAERKKARGG